jgi:beta-lactam-binding protein with PASTA domain
MISAGNSTTDLSVPELNGLSEQAARSAIEQMGFVPESFRMINGTVDAGMVISQIPPAQYAFLRSGERMGFLVSVGMQTDTEIPNVLGMSSAEADTAIRSAGFNPIIIIAPELQAYREHNEAAGIAVQQFPQGGSQYHIGLPVLIYMSLQD